MPVLFRTETEAKLTIKHMTVMGPASIAVQSTLLIVTGSHFHFYDSQVYAYSIGWKQGGHKPSQLGWWDYPAPHEVFTEPVLTGEEFLAIFAP
jgi:hypothetical protein